MRHPRHRGFEEAALGDGSGGIHRLQFDGDKICNLASTHRREAVVHAAAWYRQFGDPVEFVAGLMACEKVQAVRENLVTFQKAVRADDHVFRVADTIADGTGANRHVWRGLAGFGAARIKIGAVLAGSDILPVHSGPKRRQRVEFGHARFSRRK
jgi:hypothetical protein